MPKFLESLQMRFLVWALILLVVGCSDNDQSKTVQQFRQVPVANSGIDFNNSIQEDVSTLANLFDFDYFYNGAGVGLADINNDGLLDVFFAANQVENKLFLNMGNLKFEDITEKSGVNQGKKWSNGVTFADVNGDDYLDIYVSQGGPFLADQRKNLLFINNGDLTFSEEAERFGLADSSISTQSAFFDYDKDGDLDCIVMNENPLYGMGPMQFHQILLKNRSVIHESSSHLYENRDGKFVDVTITSGLYKPTFGLGLVVSDIDNDGWLDIYIANDYYLPDNMYINNGKGFFIDKIKEMTNQVSFYGMGADIADINNDGSQDIFVLDMASSDHKRSKTLMASMDTEAFDMLVNGFGFHSQYMFNSLQLNDGNNRFNNIAHFGKMAKTDWSWAVLMADFDLDSRKDIYITNGYRRYALDNDFKAKVSKARSIYKGEIPLSAKKELYDQMPSEKLSNLMYTVDEKFSFQEVSRSWGLEDPSYSNGAAFGDLDNDGDLDLVVNNMDENAFVYENLAGRKNYLIVEVEGALSETFAKVEIYHQGTRQFQEVKRVRGYMSAVSNYAHFGLGEAEKVDSIVVEWLGGGMSRSYNVEANQSIRFLESESLVAPLETDKEKYGLLENGSLGLNYAHRENGFNDFAEEVLLPYKQSTLGPMSAYDENSGLLFVGGALGQKGMLYRWDGDVFNFIQSIDSEGNEDMGAVFFDLENDGDLDLFVVSGGNALPGGHKGYEDRLYTNNGDNQWIRGEVPGLGEILSSSKTVEAMDINNDGFEEIVVGGRLTPQSYPLPGQSYILKNSSGQLTVETEEFFPGFEDFGLVNDLLSTDLDGDNWTDLIVVGEWTNIGMYRNVNGKFEEILTDSPIQKVKGWWYSITETDFNKDGLMDYVIGNVGLNTKFEANAEKPFKVFAKDFDATGTLDIVLSKSYKDRYVPVRGRECSSEQMPFIKEKYPTYNAFADASMDEIFGSDLNDAYEAEANEFNSVVLVNKGDLSFDLVPLPWETQLFPALDGIKYDLNKDGFEDIVLAGNIYNTEVETPRLDTKSGQILYGGKDGYKSGGSFNIPGNVKALELLPTNDGSHILLALRNNDSPVLYDLESWSNNP